MNETPRYTGTNIGAVIRSQGRSQKWVAEQAGISEYLLSKVVHGKRTIDHVGAKRLADVLGTPLFLLFELRKRSESDSVADEQEVLAS